MPLLLVDPPHIWLSRCIGGNYPFFATKKIMVFIFTCKLRGLLGTGQCTLTCSCLAEMVCFLFFRWFHPFIKFNFSCMLPLRPVELNAFVFASCWQRIIVPSPLAVIAVWFRHIVSTFVSFRVSHQPPVHRDLAMPEDATWSEVTQKQAQRLSETSQVTKSH